MRLARGPWIESTECAKSWLTRGSQQGIGSRALMPINEISCQSIARARSQRDLFIHLTERLAKVTPPPVNDRSFEAGSSTRDRFHAGQVSAAITLLSDSSRYTFDSDRHRFAPKIRRGKGGDLNHRSWAVRHRSTRSCIKATLTRNLSVLGNTIIAAPFDAHLRALVLEDMDAELLADSSAGEQLFKIRAADSAGHRSSASILVNRMYAWRGYHTNGASGSPRLDDSNRITLVAVGHDETIGTISIGFDNPQGLFVDDLFGDEVTTLRADGRRICEFTKLAMDTVVKSKRVLASLFHVAYIYAHRLKGFDSLLIEVNPRHVRYYEKMLGFKVLGPERLNRRVNAPAVLMCLDFSHAQEQIKRYGGSLGTACSERSLYPYFFSIEEEAGIVGRLRSGQYPHSVAPTRLQSLSLVAESQVPSIA